MNSYTSSSDPHRRYVQALFALALVPLYALFAIGVYLEPLWGDLTRIGSYAEKDFGWNKPQLEFTEPLSSLGRYDRYYDVVVLGDSFSTLRPNLHWQNYVVAATSLSVVTLDITKMDLEQVLANRVYRETPPRFFIVQSVERDLPERIKYQQPCGVAALPERAVQSPLRSYETTSSQLTGEIAALSKHVKRETAWSGIQLRYVLRYLRVSLLRKLVGDAHTDASKVELSRRAPFSSANKLAMLVYNDDFRTAEAWEQMGLAEIGCRIERMRSQVEANGITRFVFMAAPDKLTAYDEFLADKGLRGISTLPDLAGQHPATMPRLDLALISAIRQGEQDVYLPDDSHWGSSGYRITAETLLQFLGLRS